MNRRCTPNANTTAASARARRYGVDVHRGSLSLHPPGAFPVRISRLFEHELPLLSPWLRPVETMWGGRECNWTPRAMSLPRVFLAAEHVFGRSATCFDWYKGSFLFPLLLAAAPAGRELRYVLMLRDHLGSIRVGLHHFDEERHERDRSGESSQLSVEELGLVTNVLVDFLYFCGEAAASDLAGFHRQVPSAQLVYGYRNGDFFESCFESEEEYQCALEKISVDLREAERRDEFECARNLLRGIIGETPIV